MRRSAVTADFSRLGAEWTSVPHTDVISPTFHTFANNHVVRTDRRGMCWSGTMDDSDTDELRRYALDAVSTRSKSLSLPRSGSFAIASHLTGTQNHTNDRKYHSRGGRRSSRHHKLGYIHTPQPGAKTRRDIPRGPLFHSTIRFERENATCCAKDTGS